MPLFGPPNIEKMEAKGDVEGLIKALDYWKDHPFTLHNKVQIDAAEALGRIGDVRAVGPLITVLNRWWMRNAVAEALGKIGGPAMKPLITTLGDENVDVRQAAIETLEKVGAPAVQPLVAALRDTTGNVHQVAAKALDRIGWQPEAGSEDEEAYKVAKVELLFATLKDTDEENDVRQSALESLVEIGVLAVEPLIAALRDDSAWNAAATTLKKIGPVAVKPLIAALGEDEHFNQHLRVIYVLAAIGDKRAMEPLAAVALEHGNKYALWALDKIGDARRALQALESNERVWWQKELAGKCGACGRIVLLSAAKIETYKYSDGGDYMQESQPHFCCPCGGQLHYEKRLDMICTPYKYTGVSWVVVQDKL